MRIPLFSSYRSVLPPPHIWTIGRTRFLCARTWAEGSFRRWGSSRRENLITANFFLLSCRSLFSGHGSRVMCACSSGQCLFLHRKMHRDKPQLVLTLQIFTVFTCVGWCVCASRQQDFILTLWRLGCGAEHVCASKNMATERPQPRLLLTWSLTPPTPPPTDTMAAYEELT